MPAYFNHTLRGVPGRCVLPGTETLRHTARAEGTSGAAAAHQQGERGPAAAAIVLHGGRHDGGSHNDEADPVQVAPGNLLPLGCLPCGYGEALVGGGREGVRDLPSCRSRQRHCEHQLKANTRGGRLSRAPPPASSSLRCNRAPCVDLQPAMDGRERVASAVTVAVQVVGTAA